MQNFNISFKILGFISGGGTFLKVGAQAQVKKTMEDFFH